MPAIGRRVFAFLALLCCAGAAHAETATRVSPADAVPGAHGTTYLDLARQIVPDLALDGDGVYGGHQVIDFRHIGGPDWGSDPPDTISILDAEALPIKSGGRDRLLVLFGLEQAAEADGIGPALLALYSLDGAPKLIDIADVGYDDETSFFEPGALSLGDGKEAVLTMSTHSNAGESYQTTVLMLLRNDRLELVDAVATLAHLLRCRYISDEEPAFRVGNGGGQGYPDIVATVTQTIEPNDGTCSDEHQPPPQPGTRLVTVTYRWDGAASRYVADSDAFDKLAEEDQDRL